MSSPLSHQSSSEELTGATDSAAEQSPPVSSASPAIASMNTGLLEDDSLEPELGSGVGNDSHECPACGETYKTAPRILSCLHVFCTNCLERQANEDPESSLLEAEDGRGDGPHNKHDPGTLHCITCGQDTVLGEKGVCELPQDSVLMGQVNAACGIDMQIVCTSCKAREKAVARCMDCANFLCPNCVTAHQYMRCFENHKVVSFEELQSGDEFTLHKPVFCSIHTTENMKLFCTHCQEPLCQDCAIDHPAPEHTVERVSDVEPQERSTLRALVAEAKSKLDMCHSVQANLDTAQEELQMQRDNSRGLINETFHSYKALLEKRQEELLAELSELHSQQRSSIWELSHTVEKTAERIKDGCVFVERVTENGSTVEMLAMKKIIADQLLSLINNTPKLDTNVQLQFNTDPEKFEQAMLKAFGNLTTSGESSQDEADMVEGLGTLPLDIPDEFVNLPPNVLAEHGFIAPPVSSPGFSLPAALQSLPPLTIPNMPPMGSGMPPPPLSAVSASGDKCPSSRNSYSPAMSDSGISLDAGSTGHITLNGQSIPGLNVNNVTGLPQAMSSRGATPAPGTDAAIASLLSSVSLAGSAGPARSPTPQLSQISDINGLLNQANAQLNSLQASASGQPSPSAIMPHLTPPLPGMNGMAMGTPPPGAVPGQTFLGNLNLGLNLGQSPIPRTGKLGPMQIRCKFGQLGPGKGQFNSPHGFCLGMDEDIVVADTNNHRVQIFEKTGEFKYQFGIPGREEGQLWYPRKVAVIQHSGKYVVCDRGNERSRMQIFTKSGHFIKKIAIRYIDIVAGLAISSQGHIVAVDSVSPTVFCIAETGDLVKWFDCANYMREPSDIAVNGKEYFVCDFKGHCVVVFNEDGVFLRRIGCENITNFPNGIDISDAGDVLVGDSHGNRFHVAVFQREGSLIGEFECPYVKVSRCCGLKITAEGYIVTLAKNNHHVLVLNTLYIV